MTTINRRSTLCLSSLLTASLWLAGCSTPAHVALPDSDTVKARHQAALTLADLPPAQVLIQNADTLRIVRDAQEPAKNDEMTLFVVRPDGFISMPNIGRIKAAQRTSRVSTAARNGVACSMRMRIDSHGSTRSSGWKSTIFGN